MILLCGLGLIANGLVDYSYKHMVVHGVKSEDVLLVPTWTFGVTLISCGIILALYAFLEICEAKSPARDFRQKY